MKAIYRANFEVRGNSTADLPNALANLGWQWVFDAKRNYVVPKTLPDGCVSLPRTMLAGDAHIETILMKNGSALQWVMSFLHPDRGDPGVQWRTEIGIERTIQNKVFFSCSLYLSRTNNSLAPLRRIASRPRIVLQVLQKFKGYGSKMPLTSTPMRLKSQPEYVKAFLNLLQDNRRHHPVVFVTTHEQSKRLFFDVNRLAEALAGTAYVIVSEDKESCDMVELEMPRQFRAFDGGVRLYWPGFSYNSNPYDHPLWTKHRLVTIQTRGRDAFSKRLLNDIAAVTATSLPETLLTLGKIEEIHRRKAIEQAKEAEDTAELLKLYEQENADLQNKIAGLQKELDAKSEELYRSQARVAMIKNASDPDARSEELLPIESVADAIEQASSRWKHELVFQLNNKSEDDSPFQPASEVQQALQWLAETYWPAKLGRKKVTNFYKDIAEKIPGWEYSAKQSDGATGRYKEWYQCQWDGRTYFIPEHVGTGSSKRPEETIRIAFAWDKEHKKIVIGYIGQHQKNTKT